MKSWPLLACRRLDSAPIPWPMRLVVAPDGEKQFGRCLPGQRVILAELRYSRPDAASVSGRGHEGPAAGHGLHEALLDEEVDGAADGADRATG
jgi:hypothetical protein